MESADPVAVFDIEDADAVQRPLAWEVRGMGHQRLGRLPRTRQWQDVVDLIYHGAAADQIANATLRAAEKGLSRASDDPGLVETFWLLTQVPAAARSKNFGASLRNVGLDVSDRPSLLEIIAAFAEAVDARAATTGTRTDLGEMAQMAAAETMSDMIGDRTRSLFDTTPGDVQRAFAALATEKQFSAFNRNFYSRLIERTLEYYLSRETPNQIGENLRFATLAEHGSFRDGLRMHCYEAARIVEEFAGGWYSKTNWIEERITRQAAAGFTHVAMKKLLDELKLGARSDG